LEAVCYAQQSPPISRYICTCIYRRAYTDRILHCTKCRRCKHSCDISLLILAFCVFFFIFCLICVYFGNLFGRCTFHWCCNTGKKCFKQFVGASRVVLLISKVHFQLVLFVLFIFWFAIWHLVFALPRQRTQQDLNDD